MLNSTQKKIIEAEKNGDKDGKALYKLMSCAVYGNTMENLRNRIDLKLVSHKKMFQNWHPKQGMCHTKHLTMT